MFRSSQYRPSKPVSKTYWMDDLGSTPLRNNGTYIIIHKSSNKDYTIFLCDGGRRTGLWGSCKKTPSGIDKRFFLGIMKTQASQTGGVRTGHSAT